MKSIDCLYSAFLKMGILISISPFFHAEGQTLKNQYAPVVNTLNSPYAKLKSIDLTDVAWEDGFWKQRVALVREITMPHLS